MLSYWQWWYDFVESNNDIDSRLASLVNAQRAVNAELSALFVLCVVILFFLLQANASTTPKRILCPIRIQPSAYRQFSQSIATPHNCLLLHMHWLSTRTSPKSCRTRISSTMWATHQLILKHVSSNAYDRSLRKAVTISAFTMNISDTCRPFRRRPQCPPSLNAMHA